MGVETSLHWDIRSLSVRFVQRIPTAVIRLFETANNKKGYKVHMHCAWKAKCHQVSAPTLLNTDRLSNSFTTRLSSKFLFKSDS